MATQTFVIMAEAVCKGCERPYAVLVPSRFAIDVVNLVISAGGLANFDLIIYGKSYDCSQCFQTLEFPDPIAHLKGIKKLFYSIGINFFQRALRR